MFESLSHLITGFSIATTYQNLFYCLTGAIVGTLVGILPGLGPIAGIALLIPATFGLNPTSAIIMLAGIYYPNFMVSKIKFRRISWLHVINFHLGTTDFTGWFLWSCRDGERDAGHHIFLYE
jgi:hypothetical protein